MIELMAWISLGISIMVAVYHYYMYSNYDQVYEYIRKKYGNDTDTKFPSKDYHQQNAKKYSYYSIFFSVVLTIINFYFRSDGFNQ